MYQIIFVFCQPRSPAQKEKHNHQNEYLDNLKHKYVSMSWTWTGTCKAWLVDRNVTWSHTNFEPVLFGRLGQIFMNHQSLPLVTTPTAKNEVQYFPSPRDLHLCWHWSWESLCTTPLLSPRCPPRRYNIYVKSIMLIDQKFLSYSARPRPSSTHSGQQRQLARSHWQKLILF